MYIKTTQRNKFTNLKSTKININKQLMFQIQLIRFKKEERLVKNFRVCFKKLKFSKRNLKINVIIKINKIES